MAYFSTIFYVLIPLLLSSCVGVSTTRSLLRYADDSRDDLEISSLHDQSLRDLDHELTQLLSEADLDGDLKSRDGVNKAVVNYYPHDEQHLKKRHLKLNSLREKRKTSPEDEEDKMEISNKRHRRAHHTSRTSNSHHAFPRFRRGFHQTEGSDSQGTHFDEPRGEHNSKLRRRRQERPRRFASSCKGHGHHRHGRRVMPIEEEQNINENVEEYSDSNERQSDSNWRAKRNNNHASNHHRHRRQGGLARQRLRRQREHPQEANDQKSHVRRKRDIEDNNDINSLGQEIEEFDDDFLGETSDTNPVQVVKRRSENDVEEETEEDLAKQLDSVMDEISELIPSDSNIENEIRAYLATTNDKSRLKNKRDIVVDTKQPNNRKKRNGNDILLEQVVKEGDDSEEESHATSSLRKRKTDEMAVAMIDEQLYQSPKSISTVNKLQSAKEGEINVNKDTIATQTNNGKQQKGSDDDENDDETSSIEAKSVTRYRRQDSDPELSESDLNAINTIVGKDPAAQVNMMTRLKDSLDSLQRIAREEKARAQKSLEVETDDSGVWTDKDSDKQIVEIGYHEPSKRSVSNLRHEKKNDGERLQRGVIEDELSLKNIDDINLSKSQDEVINPLIMDEATLSKRETSNDALLPTKISVTFQSNKGTRSISSETNNEDSLVQKRNVIVKQNTAESSDSSLSKRSASANSDNSLSTPHTSNVNDDNNEQKRNVESQSDQALTSKEKYIDANKASDSVEHFERDSLNNNVKSLNHEKRSVGIVEEQFSPKSLDIGVQVDHPEQQVGSIDVSENKMAVEKRNVATSDTEKQNNNQVPNIKSQLENNDDGFSEDTDETQLEDQVELVGDEYHDQSHLDKRHTTSSKHQPGSRKQNIEFTVEHDQAELEEENRNLNKIDCEKEFSKERNVYGVDEQLNSENVNADASEDKNKLEKRNANTRDNQLETKESNVNVLGEQSEIEQSNEVVIGATSQLHKRDSDVSKDAGASVELIKKGFDSSDEKLNIGVSKDKSELKSNAIEFSEDKSKPDKRSIHISNDQYEPISKYSIDIPEEQTEPERLRMSRIEKDGADVSEDETEIEKRSLNDVSSHIDNNKINVDRPENQLKLEKRSANIPENKPGSNKLNVDVQLKQAGPITSSLEEKSKSKKRNVESMFEAPQSPMNPQKLNVKRGVESTNQILSDLGEPLPEDIANSYELMEKGDDSQSKRETIDELNLRYRDNSMKSDSMEDSSVDRTNTEDVLPSRPGNKDNIGFTHSNEFEQMNEDQIVRGAIGSTMPKIHPNEFIDRRRRRVMGPYSDEEMDEENGEFNDYSGGKFSDLISTAIRKRHSPYGNIWGNDKDYVPLAIQDVKRDVDYAYPSYSPALMMSNRAGLNPRYRSFKRSVQPFYGSLPALRRYKRYEDGKNLPSQLSHSQFAGPLPEVPIEKNPSVQFGKSIYPDNFVGSDPVKRKIIGYVAFPKDDVINLESLPENFDSDRSMFMYAPYQEEGNVLSNFKDTASSDARYFPNQQETLWDTVQRDPSTIVVEQDQNSQDPFVFSSPQTKMGRRNSRNALKGISRMDLDNSLSPRDAATLRELLSKATLAQQNYFREDDSEKSTYDTGQKEGRLSEDSGFFNVFGRLARLFSGEPEPSIQAKNSTKEMNKKSENSRTKDNPQNFNKELEPSGAEYEDPSPVDDEDEQFQLKNNNKKLIDSDLEDKISGLSQRKNRFNKNHIVKKYKSRLKSDYDDEDEQSNMDLWNEADNNEYIDIDRGTVDRDLISDYENQAYGYDEDDSLDQHYNQHKIRGKNIKYETQMKKKRSTSNIRSPNILRLDIEPKLAFEDDSIEESETNYASVPDGKESIVSNAGESSDMTSLTETDSAQEEEASFFGPLLASNLEGSLSRIKRVKRKQVRGAKSGI